MADGGSFDGCGEMLAREFPAVSFIQIDKNVGFARANNEAARQASGRFLLFLNPDTLLHEDSARVLVERLATLPQAGAVGCKLLNPDRTLQHTCVQSLPTVLNQLLDSDYLRARFPHWKMWVSAPLWEGVTQAAEVEAISGHAFWPNVRFFRRSAALRKITSCTARTWIFA